MRPLLAGRAGKFILYPATRHPSPSFEKIKIQKVQRKIDRCGWILVLLTLFSGCVHVPLSADTVMNDKLQALPPLEQGEVLVVYGENAAAPQQSAAGPYFTAGCMAAFHENTIGELIKTMLKVNPQPGRFAIMHLQEVEKEEGAVCTAIGSDSIFSRLNLSKAGVSMDRLRYAICVKENFEVKVHLPLYVIPFGLASCSNRTVLEADVWELPAERFMGSLTVSAEGEFTVIAYMLHLVVFHDTQKDATERLAQELMQRLTGPKPLEIKTD